MHFHAAKSSSHPTSTSNRYKPTVRVSNSLLESRVTADEHWGGPFEKSDYTQTIEATLESGTRFVQTDGGVVFTSKSGQTQKFNPWEGMKGQAGLQPARIDKSTGEISLGRAHPAEDGLISQTVQLDGSTTMVNKASEWDYDLLSPFKRPPSAYYEVKADSKGHISACLVEPKTMLSRTLDKLAFACASPVLIATGHAKKLLSPEVRTPLECLPTKEGVTVKHGDQALEMNWLISPDLLR